MKRHLLGAISWALLLVSIVVVADSAARTGPVVWLLRGLFVVLSVPTLYDDWRAGHLSKTLGQLHRSGVKAGVQSLALIVGSWAMVVTT